MVNTIDKREDIVLIVEDTAANYEVVQSFLNDIDVQCENVFDGLEAITMCSSVDKDYYSLILMDINLPYMNGFEITRRLRDLDIKTPIIAITASNKEDIGIKNSDVVFDAILFKPFNYMDFYTSISPYIKNAGAFASTLKITMEEADKLPNIDARICDIHHAISNMGGNPRLFIKHFNNFKNNNMDLGLRLKELIDNHNYAEASILCHSVKGLSGMLSLISLYQHIIELEGYLKNISNHENNHYTGNLSAKPSETELTDKEIDSLLYSICNDIRLVCQIQF